MGEGLLRKDFILPPGDWSEDHAETIEGFFAEIVRRAVTMKTGAYLGSGREQVVPVVDLPGPPKLMVIQPMLGGSAYVTLLAYPAGNIIKWTNKGFTLSVAAAVNTQNVQYVFFIVA